jgi:hypothetical protein
LGAGAPSNRITVGLIGCGHQSQRIVPSFLVHEDVQMVAVCDVNRQGLGYYYPDQLLGRETARRWVNEHYAEKRPSGKFQGCDVYNDFRELVARQDIDAVAVVVPDHWHALIAIAAMRAGKDVYCEKPLALTIRQGQCMVEAVRTHKRVFQTGAQFRSCPGVRRACELVRNGRLGEIRRVRTWVDPNSFKGPGPGWKPMPVPDGFDYDFWLGPAPEGLTISNGASTAGGTSSTIPTGRRRTSAPTPTTSPSGASAWTAPRRSSSKTPAPSFRPGGACSPRPPRPRFGRGTPTVWS